MTPEEIQQREKEVHTLDQEMRLLEQDTKTLAQMLVKLQEIHQRQQKLEHYYFEEGYRKDRQIEDQFQNTYGLLSEDGLFNLFYDVDQEQLKILKYLVKNL